MKGKCHYNLTFPCSLSQLQVLPADQPCPPTCTKYDTILQSKFRNFTTKGFGLLKKSCFTIINQSGYRHHSVFGPKYGRFQDLKKNRRKEKRPIGRFLLALADGPSNGQGVQKWPKIVCYRVPTKLQLTLTNNGQKQCVTWCQKMTKNNVSQGVNEALIVRLSEIVSIDSKLFLLLIYEL